MARNNSVRLYVRQVFRVLYGVLEVFFHWLFGMVYGGDGESMPPITDLLLLESASSIAYKIRNRKVRVWVTSLLCVIFD